MIPVRSKYRRQDVPLLGDKVISSRYCVVSASKRLLLWVQTPGHPQQQYPQHSSLRTILHVNDRQEYCLYYKLDVSKMHAWHL